MTNEQTLALLRAKITSFDNSINYINTIMETPCNDDAKILLVKEVLRIMENDIAQTLLYMSTPYSIDVSDDQYKIHPRIRTGAHERHDL